MDVIQDFTPVNFTKGGLKEVRGIVLHSMWGTYTGSIAWFKNPDAGASAHFLISEKGEIRQMVRETDMAWHAGIYDEPIPDYLRPNPNFYTIGIELEDKRDANWSYPQSQRDATAWLLDLLLKKYGLSEDKLFLHKELNPSRRSDPVGQFSRDWALKDFRTQPNKTDEERAWEVLMGYRSVRKTPNGAEGNVEGYVRAIIGNDEKTPALLKDLESAKSTLSINKAELSTQLALKDQQIDDLNTSWTTKIAILNNKLEHNSEYVLNLSDKKTLLVAFLNKFLGLSKSKDELDAMYGDKGVAKDA